MDLSKNYADIVKGVHANLRKELKRCGDYHAVWKEHVKDVANLQTYSKSMHALAEHWKQLAVDDRTEWCVNVFQEYFHLGGIEKALKRELKKKYFENLQQDTSVLTWEEYYHKESCTVGYADRTKLSHNKVQLLDVGSCYNPFEKFSDECETIAIDLCPDNQEVLQADFLELIVTENITVTNKVEDNYAIMLDLFVKRELDLTQSSGNSNDTTQSKREVPHRQNDCSSHLEEAKIICDTTGHKGELSLRLLNKEAKVKTGDTNDSVFSRNKSVPKHMSDIPAASLSINTLPANTFDVVVFSLFLSYFPSYKQRWISCVKAHQLLKNQGLLIIIESDSSHQNRNTTMIKAWKSAIEGLGFTRYKYEKLEHLHCMAFRKSSVVPNLTDKSEDLLFIPQDFQEDDNDIDQPNSPRNDNEDDHVFELFSELPDTTME